MRQVANQQATPTESEIAWLAGIIEGEGTLSMGLWRHNGPDRKPKIALNVKVYNSDAGIMRQVASILERLTIGFHLKEREMPPMLRADGDGHYRPTAPMITVTIARLAYVDQVLKAIRPWLYGDKAARADLMLKFIERRMTKHGIDSLGKRSRYDAGDIRIALQFFKNGRHKNVAEVERVLNELEQCPDA